MKHVKGISSTDLIPQWFLSHISIQVFHTPATQMLCSPRVNTVQPYWSTYVTTIFNPVIVYGYTDLRYERNCTNFVSVSYWSLIVVLSRVGFSIFFLFGLGVISQN
jgi:hypothetical protein